MMSKMSFPLTLASKIKRKMMLVIFLLCTSSRDLYIHYFTYVSDILQRW